MATTHPTTARKAATKHASTRSTSKHAAKKHAARKASKRRAKKKLPVCTTKDLKTRKSRRRKCRVVKARPKVAAPPRRATPTGPVAAPPAVAPSPDAFPTAPTAAGATDGARGFTGTFGVAQAARLLHRAGFGPLPGQAEAFAELGLLGAVRQLIAPGPATLVGPAPTGAYLVGGQFAPADKYGHLHLAMLDRQVRSTDSLTERMTLVLHDWFGVGSDATGLRFASDHIDLLRANWRGSFRDLLKKVAQSPAMLTFLNGIDNTKTAPNENFGRELMELFTLGADRGAYTETDVREMARTFTGFRADYSPALGLNSFRFDTSRFDTGTKTLFAGTAWERSGPLSWLDGVDAVVDHPLHPSFVVLKLWSYFVPTAPSPLTQADLEAIYRGGGEQLEPLVQAILIHPDLYAGPDMVKPPVVHAAGLLRSRESGITTDAWIYRCSAAGQLMGYPPNVSGWNDRAWLNTSTHSARWGFAQELVNTGVVRAADYTDRTETDAEALDAALSFWGRPQLGDDHLAALRVVAQQTWAPKTPGDQYGSLATFLAHRQNVLRQLVAAAPDVQVS